MDKKKILIVEDERIIAEDIERTLQNFNYEVISVVSSGVDAIRIVRDKKPDMVLMDIVLDGDMNGVEVAEKIRKVHRVPIIYLTAYADEKTLTNAKVTDPFGYILKPFDERELRTTIEMAFYKYKMENALVESEKFLRHIIDIDPNIIFVKDLDFKYVLVNKAMSELYGIPIEKMIGKTDLELANISNLTLIEAKRYHSDDKFVINTGKPKFIIEAPFTFKRGKRKWFQTNKVPITLKNSQRGILGVAVDITARKETEEELKKSVKKLKRIFEETVSCLVTAVEIRDPYTAGHQRRVSKLAVEIGKVLGLEEEMLEGIRIAALIHDIGKINIPAEILSKPGKLTEAEFNLIKIHPQAGYDIIIPIEFPWPVADIILQHQERFDGSSYPFGLKGEEIKLEARIIAVADVIEAMASHRPYRPALGIEKALHEIITNKGILYDPQVVDACVKIFREDNFKLI